MEPHKAESIFLGIPTYDNWVHIGCCSGILHATKSRHIKMQCIGSSALPFAFNQLWANAICNHEAEGTEYFGMCHADVGPDGYWADTLIEEMESHQADLISATIPIKDESNVYSVAMCHQDSPAHYRLTIPHYMELPETYTTEDMQRVTGEDGLLCVNTGLWACRLDRPWVKKVHFEFITSIDWSGEKPRCHFLPEDWRLSQMLHALGAKVVGTKKVRCTHAGQHTWQSAPRAMNEVVNG